MPSTTHDVTVLLIEDEAEIRRFLRSTLPVHGYRLYEAPTGAEGLAQAAFRNPDIILLDLDAGDYVTKPFGADKLLPRMHAALRHAARSVGDGELLFIQGDLAVDLGKRQVVVAGKEVHLMPIEYKLLTTLVLHAGKVMTHR